MVEDTSAATVPVQPIGVSEMDVEAAYALPQLQRDGGVGPVRVYARCSASEGSPVARDKSPRNPAARDDGAEKDSETDPQPVDGGAQSVAH